MAATPAASATFTKPSADTLEARYLHTRKLGGDQPKRIDALQESVTDLAKNIVELTPPSAEQERALDTLDGVLFMATLAITRNERR